MRLSQEDTRNMGLTKGKGEGSSNWGSAFTTYLSGSYYSESLKSRGLELARGWGVYLNFWESIASVHLCGWVNLGIKK